MVVDANVLLLAAAYYISCLCCRSIVVDDRYTLSGVGIIIFFICIFILAIREDVGLLVCKITTKGITVVSLWNPEVHDQLSWKSWSISSV